MFEDLIPYPGYKSALRRTAMALSVSVIELLTRQVHSDQRKDRLLAFEELRRMNLLQDGSLNGLYLSGLDLQGANLSGAVMQFANLSGTNLRGADLHWIDLRHADLTGAIIVGANLLWANLEGTRGVTDEQLAQVYILRRAMLPSGQTYDGRYCLPGDLDDASRDRIKADNEEGLARWYEVSLEAYREGQQWAAQNARILQPRLHG